MFKFDAMKIRFLVLFISLAVILFSCQKEEDLTPIADLATSQQAGIDFHNQGGGGNGGGGGTGGNEPQIVEFFSANVDGMPLSSSDPSLQNQLGQNFISSTSLSIDNSITINIPAELEVRTYTFFLATYFRTANNSLQSINGEVTLDSVTTSFIQGRFFFDAVDANGMDSVSVSDGSFKIKR